MGERSKGALRVAFGRKVKVAFHGTKVTSDAGLLAYRELDEVLKLRYVSEMIINSKSMVLLLLWLKYFQNEVGKL